MDKADWVFAAGLTLLCLFISTVFVVQYELETRKLDLMEANGCTVQIMED